MRQQQLQQYQIYGEEEGSVRNIAAVQTEQMKAGFLLSPGPSPNPNPFSRGNYQVKHANGQQLERLISPLASAMDQVRRYSPEQGSSHRDAAEAYRHRQAEYESAARREYFSTREAAQAHKRKVEALERGAPASSGDQDSAVAVRA